MRILVTGATGFLGGHLVPALLARGHQVRGVGRDVRRLAQLRAAGAEAVSADLRDAAAVDAACAGVDLIYHAGAFSAAWGPPREFHSINVDGTANVLAGCRRHRVGRLVHVSSPSVLFDGRDQHAITDDAPYARRYLCVYSLTKKLAEDLVHAAGRAGLATVTLRPKAMFGPGDTTLLPKLIDVARRGRLPQVGDGSNRVDLTYVANVVEALLLAGTADAAVGRTYTITNDEHVLLWELIRGVLRRLGLNDRLRRLPYPIAAGLAWLMEARCRVLGGEPLLTRYTVALLARHQTYDISAARRDLGYEPRISVAEGVERTLADLGREPRG